MMFQWTHLLNVILIHKYLTGIGQGGEVSVVIVHWSVRKSSHICVQDTETFSHTINIFIFLQTKYINE
jgi:hypothetical protein